MDEYKEIRNLLKPRRDIKASETFRKKIENDLCSDMHTVSRLRWLYGSLLFGAAAVLLILLFVPSRLSAHEVLTEAISAIKRSANIEMKLEIRTKSREIFDYINPKANFVLYDILIDRNDSLTYWYVDKGERAAEKNNTGLYIWIKPFNIGWHYSEQEPNVLGYFNIFLHPQKILESELKYTLSAPKANYEITKRNGEIILTIHSQPEGNYSNPYVLNTSVEDSESIRRYILDAKNYRLKSATVSFIINNKEVEVIKMTSIKYGLTNKNLPPVPSDITFIEEEGQTSFPGIPGLDAREAASVFLNALYTWDTGILYKFLSPIEAENVYRPEYEGAKILTLGTPFQSGSNSHLMFVPYTLRLKDGRIVKMNLVMAKYSDDTWSFDGGL